MHGYHFPATLYWLVDGVLRLNWDRDYLVVVQDIWAARMAKEKDKVMEHLDMHWKSKPGGLCGIVSRSSSWTGI
jgi:hypothetical protein